MCDMTHSSVWQCDALCDRRQRRPRPAGACAYMCDVTHSYVCLKWRLLLLLLRKKQCSSFVWNSQGAVYMCEITPFCVRYAYICIYISKYISHDPVLRVMIWCLLSDGGQRWSSRAGMCVHLSGVTCFGVSIHIPYRTHSTQERESRLSCVCTWGA